MHAVELRAYLHALRVRWVLVVALTLLGGVVSVVAVLLTPPVYASTVTFYVSTPPTDAANAANATQYAQSKINSYVALLRSEEVARRVIADQRLDTTSAAAVAASIDASAQLNTLVLTATVHDTDGQRSLAVARGLADTFGRLVDELDNRGRGSDVVRVDVVSGPTLATTPVSPRPARVVALGLLIGLLVGALVAVLRDLLDVSIRSSAAAVEATGLPTLATVDHEPEAAGRAEAVRQLRTSLAFLGVAAPGGGSGTVLLVTSALAAEGRTTLALDLARSVAETGARVLLLEADLRAPVLADRLGLDSRPGLADVLAGSVAAATAIRTSVGEIAVLTAGTLPPNPAELLGSPRMAALVDALRTDYDLVVVDVAPVVSVTDAVVCATVADGVLLVVRWGRTARSDVTEACAALRQVQASILGTALNGRQPSGLRRHRPQRSSSAPKPL